jgi:hypothetical protein
MPDFIIGDLNFTGEDEEYKYMAQKGYYTKQVNYTTPYGTQVDWIFSKKKLDLLQVE